ncbi:MAG: O-antigen ligase family protein [Vicinamibacteraceae bacterium]
MNAVLPATSAVSRPAPFHLLLCGTLVLYVYRVFVIGANLSLFRIVLAGWTLVALAGLVRGRTPLGRWHLALGGLAAAIVALNAADFAGLAGHPDLRRDILNHLQNVWFTVLLALHLRSHAAVISLLAAFVWSSLLTSALTLASWVMGALPLESWLRAHGGPATRDLRFLGYDYYFNRATSTFFDPNFYGIYSALVVLTALGLWLTVERRRWLLWLAAANVFFLSASLSRTGFVALLGGLGAALIVYRRGPRPARLVVALMAAGACLCFVGASVVQSRANRARATVWWLGPATVNANPGLAAGLRARMEPPADQDRLTGSASVSDRFRRIRHGWAVFTSSPWLGRGGAALLSPNFPPHASAHLVYLTLLARYGIVGTLVYAAFALSPLVAIVRRRGPPADQVVVTVAACLSLVFLSYDVFLGFEIDYLFFGVAWALAALPPGDAGPRSIADGGA